MLSRESIDPRRWSAQGITRCVKAKRVRVRRHTQINTEQNAKQGEDAILYCRQLACEVDRRQPPHPQASNLLLMSRSSSE